MSTGGLAFFRSFFRIFFLLYSLPGIMVLGPVWFIWGVPFHSSVCQVILIIIIIIIVIIIIIIIIIIMD